jgi:hypothetical protein
LFTGRVARIANVRNPRPRRSQTIFECQQTGIFQLCPSKIDLAGPVCLAFLNHSPKEKRHSAQVVKSFVGAAVLVHYRSPVLQCEDGSDGETTFADQANRDIGARAGDNVAEPRFGLWQYLVTSARDPHEPIEVINQLRRASLLVREMFAFGSLDAALYAAFMQAGEYLAKRRRQIEHMEPEALALNKRRIRVHWQGKWPKLTIFPIVLETLSFYPIGKYREIGAIIQEWIDMIRERQRNQAISSEGTPDLTEYNCLL